MLFITVHCSACMKQLPHITLWLVRQILVSSLLSLSLVAQHNTGLSLGAQHYNGLLLAGCEDWSLVLMRIVWLRAGWGKWLESSVISQETLSQSDTRLLICLGMMYNCAGVLDLIWINVNQLEIWRITVLLCSSIIQYLCFRAYPTTVIPVLSYLETISLVIVAAKWSQDADKGV